MAYRFEREKTPSTPYILIDEENRYLRLEGKSFHENVIEYFRDLVDWVGAFLESDFPSFTFDCRLDYFNSSTAKLLWNLLMDMNESENAANITVNWITGKDNLIVTEMGEEYQEDMDCLKFNIIVE